MQTFLRVFIFAFAFVGVAGQVQAQKHACALSRSNSVLRQASASVAHTKRMHQYDVKFYKLDIALERTSTFISGNAIIKAESKDAALDTFAFELHPNLTIDSVLINNVKRTGITRTGSDVNVVLPSALGVGAVINTIIYYKGTPPSGASAAIGNGMSNATSGVWGNQVTWSLSQPNAAAEWWPCKQVLTDKADSVEVHVTTSASNKVGSNGLLKNTVTLPNNKVRYEWKSRYPIAYYLISVAVAEYVDYTIFANPVGASQPIPIQNYIYNNPQTLATFQDDIDDTAPMLVKFSELFGLYPFHQEKYGHAMAPFGGGMEHQTMTTQGFFEFTLTAHELAHQWFGDDVTCASWQDIWLNEGFASYGEYLALEHLQPGQQLAWMNSTHNPPLNRATGTVHVADTNNVARIFDSALSYDKGAAVVHMLRYEFNNDSLFFNMLQTYLQQFSGSTARTADLKSVAEAKLGRNMDDFFNQWIYGQGYPTFAVRWNQVGNQLILQSNQTTSSPVTPLFKTDLDYRITTSQGQVKVRLHHDQNQKTFYLPVNGTVSGIMIDPDQWILNRNGTIIRDVNLVAGVSDAFAASKISVFPNPCTDFLKLEVGLTRPATARIFDMTGRLVSVQHLDTPEPVLNTRMLQQGCYYLKLDTGKELQVASFIKQ